MLESSIFTAINYPAIRQNFNSFYFCNKVINLIIECWKRTEHEIWKHLSFNEKKISYFSKFKTVNNKSSNILGGKIKIFLS